MNVGHHDVQVNSSRDMEQRLFWFTYYIIYMRLHICCRTATRQQVTCEKLAKYWENNIIKK